MDKKLAQLDRLIRLHPKDDQLRHRWLQARERHGLPSFLYRIWLEPWTYEDFEESADGEVVEPEWLLQTDWTPATKNDLIQAMERYRIRHDSFIGNDFLCSALQDQYKTDFHISDDVSMIGTVMEIRYVDQEVLDLDKLVRDLGGEVRANYEALFGPLDAGRREGERVDARLAELEERARALEGGDRGQEG